jgi:hypothetical protein
MPLTKPLTFPTGLRVTGFLIPLLTAYLTALTTSDNAVLNGNDVEGSDCNLSLTIPACLEGLGKTITLS